MQQLKRWAGLWALLASLGLAGCSTLTLAYQQLPLLAGLWADRYFDLDSAQRSRLKQQVVTWQAWHRRDELPQWQALLRQAQAALDRGVTRDDLLTLERGVQASLERCLQHAAPLMAPLLSDLRPEQWQHWQRKTAEATTEWRERNSGRGGAAERGKRFVDSLERWLGDLDRPLRRQARAEADAWQVDVNVLAQAREQRLQQTLAGLKAWAHQDLAAGTALLMQTTRPQATEQPFREEALASVLKLMQGMTPAQREQVRQHWSRWQAEFSKLQAG